MAQGVEFRAAGGSAGPSSTVPVMRGKRGAMGAIWGATDDLVLFAASYEHVAALRGVASTDGWCAAFLTGVNNQRAQGKTQAAPQMCPPLCSFAARFPLPSASCGTSHIPCSQSCSIKPEHASVSGLRNRTFAVLFVMLTDVFVCACLALILPVPRWIGRASSTAPGGVASVSTHVPGLH